MWSGPEIDFLFNSIIAKQHEVSGYSSCCQNGDFRVILVTGSYNGEFGSDSCVGLKEN